jgi:ribosomal protein S14
MTTNNQGTYRCYPCGGMVERKVLPVDPPIYEFRCTRCRAVRLSREDIAAGDVDMRVGDPSSMEFPASSPSDRKVERCSICGSEENTGRVLFYLPGQAKPYAMCVLCFARPFGLGSHVGT